MFVRKNGLFRGFLETAVHRKKKYLCFSSQYLTLILLLCRVRRKEIPKWMDFCFVRPYPCGTPIIMAYFEYVLFFR